MPVVCAAGKIEPPWLVQGSLGLIFQLNGGRALSGTLEVAEVGYPTVTLDTSGKNGVQYVSLGRLRSNLYNLCMISFNKIFFQKIGFYKVV